MANKFLHLRSGISGVAPTPAQIEIGQIAMNYNDEYLFILNSAGEVVVIGSAASVTRSNFSIISVNGVVPDSSGALTLNPANIGANGVVPINGSGKIDTQYLPEALVGAVTYQGTWDAATNTPTLDDPTTVKGWYYVVTTAGTQFGNAYGVGDWVISNGIEWQKVDAIDAVTSVAGKTGAVVLAAGDIASGIFASARLGANSGNDLVLTTAGTGAPVWVAKSTLSGVTSVGLSLPAEFTVSGSPVTGTGTLAATKAAQTQNTVWAGPVSGANAAPTFRALDAADIPSLDTAKITTGVFAPARLGATPGNDSVLTTDETGAPEWVDRATFGVGSVSSVGMTVPAALLSVTGSPITTSGTLAVSLPARAANLIFAGPTSGADATPTFRAMVADDVPTLDEGTF